MSGNTRNWPCISGEALKAARCWRGLSQTDLAKAVGMSRNTVSSLEHNSRDRKYADNCVRPATLRKIAKVLDVEQRLLTKGRVTQIEDILEGIKEGANPYDVDDMSRFGEVDEFGGLIAPSLPGKREEFHTWEELLEMQGDA